MYDVIFSLGKILTPDLTNSSSDEPFSCTILKVRNIFSEKRWFINKFHAQLRNNCFYLGLRSDPDPVPEQFLFELSRIQSKNFLIINTLMSICEWLQKKGFGAHLRSRRWRNR